MNAGAPGREGAGTGGGSGHAAPASGTFSRVWSAALALVVVIPAISLSLWTATAVCLVAAILGLREFYGMALPRERRSLTVVGGAVATLMMGVAPLAGSRPELVVVPFGLGVLVGTTWFLATARETADLAPRTSFFLAGLMYVPGTILFLPLLYGLGESHQEWLGVKWVWLALVTPWCSDTGAYFAGRAFGRHKMSPLISPKKSWEGLVGGVLAAIAAAAVFRWVTGFVELSWADCVLLGAGLAVAGVVGDLVESMLKRSFGVKDSGFFLPGHGGLLDRVDSVMFVMPLAYLYAALRLG
ncbi:phosphatidate cytidylyltransferase [Myxococcota bacterium]|nr:phosphatidate cytidylyltransferase [Myxococcota bacterium]